MQKRLIAFYERLEKPGTQEYERYQERLGAQDWTVRYAQEKARFEVAVKILSDAEEKFSK